MDNVRHHRVSGAGIDTFFCEGGRASAPLTPLQRGYRYSSYEFRNIHAAPCRPLEAAGAGYPRRRLQRNFKRVRLGLRRLQRPPFNRPGRWRTPTSARYAHSYATSQDQTVLDVVRLLHPLDSIAIKRALHSIGVPARRPLLATRFEFDKPDPRPKS